MSQPPALKKLWKKFKQVQIISLALCCLAASNCLPASAANPLPAEDSELLNQIERDTIQYFTRFSDKVSGLTRDSSRSGSPASIAATGFAIASVSVAQSRGWIPKEQAYKQIDKTLRFILTQAEHKNGFFYHFLDSRTGKRSWGSEASSIDTALLLAGALLAAEYFPGTDIEKNANAIYERVDWSWMLNNTELICMGWKPESGFLHYYWDSYNELMILQALAIGSPTHPVPPSTWEAWLRREGEYEGKTIIYSYSGSLFTYQYSHAFIDFRNLSDGGINYFDNSREATLLNRLYSQSFQLEHKSYRENSWGLSASLGPGGYKAYGGKPGEGIQDGTVAPYAALSAIVFTPEFSIEAVKHFYSEHPELYGPYGFKGAINEDKNWIADEYLGIDQGISVLMLENFLNEGAVWQKFMRLEFIGKWIKLSGLKSQLTQTE